MGLFDWFPPVILVHLITDPDSVKDQFSNAGRAIAEGGKNFVHDPLKYTANAVSDGMKSAMDRMDNPLGFYCDQLGMDQPEFLKDFNDKLNAFHKLNEIMKYANGNDLVPTLKHMKEVATQTTQAYQKLVTKASEAVEFFTGLAVTNAFLVGIPESALAAKLPHLELATMHDIRQQMPQPNLGDDKPTNLFDVWKNGGSKDLPSGVKEAFEAGRYALPTSIIWANIGSQLYNLLSFAGRDQVKKQIKEWQHFLEVIALACSNAEAQIVRYTGLTRREGAVYVAFAKAVNAGRRGEPGVENLVIPPQASTGFRTIEDLHDHIRSAQHDAARILGEALGEIPSFSKYLEATAFVAEGYQEFLSKRHDKKVVTLAVDAFLASDLAQETIDQLDVHREPIRRLLILVTLWGSVHHGQLVLTDLSGKVSDGEEPPKSLSLHVVELYADYLQNLIQFARRLSKPEEMVPFAAKLLPHLLGTFSMAEGFWKGDVQRFTERREFSDLIDVAGFGYLLVEGKEWPQLLAVAPAGLLTEVEAFRQGVQSAGSSNDGVSARVSAVADAFFRLYEFLLWNEGANRLDPNHPALFMARGARNRREDRDERWKEVQRIDALSKKEYERKIG